MAQTWVVVTASIAYLGVLFAVAYYGDRRADAGRSLINSGTVYALSLAVYATSWTYYGSVGRAATSGAVFLTIYIGPTLMFALGWLIIRRIIRISRRHRITSLADFVSARYGKSPLLGGVVTVVVVIGIVPYISLQLKAVSVTFETIRHHPAITPASALGEVPMLRDTALYIALLLAGFTILFGTRHLDATERHEGMVAAIALESTVKIIAFVAAGVFVTFHLFHGFGDLFARAAEAGHTTLFSLGTSTGEWVWLIVLSMLASVLLPRQWQITVVENVDERHLKTAMWLFPLYLLVINIFVLPIAAAGLLTFGGTADADTHVLTLPMAAGNQAITLLVFIGGLSAATGMIVVETVAISTMVSNSLVLPVLLRAGSRLRRHDNPARLVLVVRRVTIVVIMLLGYAYFRLAGQGAALVSIGLVSFAAVAQFAPSILGGLFWKNATRKGALAGLVAGFVLWAYTLLLPAFADAGLIPVAFLNEGPFSIDWLRPQQLFGVSGMGHVSHAMFWTMLVNVGAYVGVSLAGRPTASEQVHAALFIDALREPTTKRSGSGRVSVGELHDVLSRFLGQAAATQALREYAAEHGADPARAATADTDLVQHVETLLAGSVGTASARIVIASVVGEEELRLDEVMTMIDEASQVATLEERHRLARELHDSVSQALFSMTLHTRAVELAVQQDGTDPHGPAARGLTELRALTQGALAEMRAALFQLRPDALHEEGLTEAIRKRAAAIEAREGIAVRVYAPEERLPLDAHAEEELFRVVQEAVHNSVKHARPSAVDIQLHGPREAEGALVVEVIDDGAGFDPDAPRISGMGLSSMRERMERIGGRLSITSSPQGSTIVRATLLGSADRETTDGHDSKGAP